MAKGTLKARGVQLAILPELVRDDVAGMLARGGLRDSTIRRYLSPARSWVYYCQDRGELPHDAGTHVLLRWLDGRARNARSIPSALAMSLAAARWVQRAYCTVHDIETVPYTPRARIQLGAYLASATTLSTRPTRSAKALRLEDLAALVERVRARPHFGRGLTYDRASALAERDAALLIVGWWGALRADDLARLEWPHVHCVVQGLELHMPASKTTAAVLALAEQPHAPALCPVHAVRELTRDGWPTEGYVFGLGTGDHVGRRLRALFARAGVPRGYTGHSLRAGFATECASQNVPDRLVQQHGRWRSVQQHAEYVRLGRLWVDTPTTRVIVPCSSVH